VYLACKHPVLVRQYSDLLTGLGVANRVLWSDWRVIVQGESPLRRFADVGGFLPNVAVGGNSAYWQGHPKSDVLLLLLESYGNPQSILDRPFFSSEKLG
jgi:hypothetical protein